MNAQSPTTPSGGKAPPSPSSSRPGPVRQSAQIEPASRLGTGILAHFPRRKALLAISGGRDSVALLDILLADGRKNIVLCHLNHGLRGNASGQDAAFVRRLAAKHGLTCEIEKADIASLAKHQSQSIETVARTERHAFLRRAATKHRAKLVFLAHHLDDQAETILANLCRGTGTNGLSGMSPITQLDNGLTLLRPLLRVSRNEIDAHICAHHLSFREDASNRDPIHRRNRLRLEAIPLLNDIFRRDTAPLMASAADLSQADNDCLNQLAATVPGIHHPELPITDELRALHPAILSRALRTWLTQMHQIPNLGRKEIEAAQSMLAPDGPAKVNLPKNRRLRRTRQRLWIETVSG